MSEAVPNAVEATEPVAAPVITDATAPAVPEVVDVEAPAAATAEPSAVPATEEVKDTTAPVDEAKPAEVAEKTVEPITEGQLSHKGPGVLKSLLPSKREFWLSDEPVTSQNLDLYLRGEKPEVSHPVVAWASQTGKGLLFMSKKNADRAHPTDIFALYDATDLKKSSPHELSFKVNGQTHAFKAANDAERDGWYLSIEKAIELSKATTEEVRNSEGYKTEIENLNKSNIVAGAVKAPKKSTEADQAAADPAAPAEETQATDAQKKQKSRSTSRGMLNRFKGKKEEVEQKVADKKEEKEAEKEEKKVESEEAAPVSDATEAAPIAAAVAASEIPAAAEASEAKAVEETPAVEEKPKPSKRGSIFGKAWGSMKSPVKEKDIKEAELKPEAPKDAVVSENPPQLPETATTEPVTETAVPSVEEPVETKAEAPKEEVTTPSKEKSNFLSGLGFMKRGRSVSPSTVLKEQPKKNEAAPVAEEPVAEAAKVEEPAPEVAAAQEPAVADEEPKKETTPNKRHSVLGSLGRRASKAFNRSQAPKKENAAATATDAPKEEETEAKAAEETPAVDGEAKETATEDAQKSIGDVVPDAVNVGQPQAPVVTASA